MTTQSGSITDDLKSQSATSATGSSKPLLNDIAPEDASEIVKAMKKAKDMFLTNKPPADPLLESILSRTIEVDRTRPTQPLTHSTFDTSRRRIFRFWPRDPDGPVLRYSSEGKRAPNGTHLWGSTLYDFYHTNRMPFNSHSVTITTGSRMAEWCKEIKELDYAAQEIDWAENREEEPKKREAANVADVHEATVDFKLTFTRWGKGEIEKSKAEGRKDDDVENYRTPFHPSSYPPPYPTPPFVTGVIPRLESTVPIHLLPEKLVVHDPDLVLCRPSDKKRSTDPWPFDSSNLSSPKGYKTQIYKLALQSDTLERIAKTRESVKAAVNTDPIPIFYVYPASENCKTRDPIFEITIPAPPPPPTHTPEAHLFLTRSPEKRKGVGNHSVVFEAEWEVPREWFVKPRICVGCIMERAEAVRDKWVAAEEERIQNKETVQNTDIEMASPTSDRDSREVKMDDGNTSPPAEDVVLPNSKRASISFPRSRVKLWDRVPEKVDILPVENHPSDEEERANPHLTNNHEVSDSELEPQAQGQAFQQWKEVQDAKQRVNSDTVGTDGKRPFIGNVSVRRETYESSAFTMSLKTVEEMRLQHEKLAKAKRGDGHDPWEKYREDNASKGTPTTNTAEQQPASGVDNFPESIPVPIVVYTGTMHTIHISSVPWLLPGDPPCKEHGIQDLHSPSDATDKNESDGFFPLVPCSALPPFIRPNTRLPPTMRVTVSAKVSIPGDRHLVSEARNYQQFDPSFNEHWTGYTVAKPLLEPTPCGALVPGFYGYYNREGEGSGEVAADDPNYVSEQRYFSPLLLLEDCGDPIEVDTLNLDNRYECSALLLRFHDLGWTHGSFAPRNLLMRRGDHEEYPMMRSNKDKRFRLIDFGRSTYLENISKDDAEERDRWDSRRFQEKNEIWKTLELPTPM
ncbi:hypothetical protein E1B28_011531 [Marasmius oreades]|uniref:Protein kinase domain-containing protein n=1 Tax=Marasmius oreades TaxID=181124 RepID=A0A9P7UPP1_9AGAR|nr:uncharacterized protein E1B28_011531 [Marasmius oreades]KAG7089897.1 hypothetical protein E1B28_011531 [Marasmius oreades]